MLTKQALAELCRAHEDDLVLSVYLARESADPGAKGAWRLRLESALAQVRADVEQESPDDLTAFDRAADHVTAQLASFGRVLPHEGWVAFATADELCYAGGLPFAPPEMVRWRQGIYAAPYVRALKAQRPLALVLTDHWRARIYSYEVGQLTVVKELTAERDVVDASDVGVSKRAATNTGVRGSTRVDYATRIAEQNAKRMRREVAAELQALVGTHGGVVLGGTERAVAALHGELEPRFAGRMVEAPELSFDSTTDELVAAAADGASRLTVQRQSQLLEAFGNGRGSLGWNETYRALGAGAVDTLLVARPWLESSPDDAERLVRLALAQGADVEELSDELGHRLYADADGVAARLRFKPTA